MRRSRAHSTFQNKSCERSVLSNYEEHCGVRIYLVTWKHEPAHQTVSLCLPRNWRKTKVSMTQNSSEASDSATKTIHSLKKRAFKHFSKQSPSRCDLRSRRWRHFAFSTESCFGSGVQVTHVFLIDLLTQCWFILKPCKEKNLKKQEVQNLKEEALYGVWAWTGSVQWTCMDRPVVKDLL